MYLILDASVELPVEKFGTLHADRGAGQRRNGTVRRRWGWRTGVGGGDVGDSAGVGHGVPGARVAPHVTGAFSP